MKHMNDFLQNPEVINNFDLLSSLGILDHFNYCNRKIHDLEQLLSDAIEIFNRSSNEDLIDYIISNIVDRFVPSYLQFTFRSHGQNEHAKTICYHNLKKVDSPAPIHSLAPYNSFFHAFPGTISYTLFEYSVDNPKLAEQLKPLSPEFIIPVNGPNDLYGLIVVGQKVVDGDYSDEEIIYIDRLMSFASISFQNSLHYHSSVTDHKTQLYNHSFFIKRLNEELAKVKRYAKSIAVLILDIDFFKQLNDKYGHLAGDKVLFQLARTLEKSLRREDILARFGGEEFIVLLPESTKEAAYHVAERIRSDIEQMEIPYLEQTLRITISIGVNFVDKVRLDTADSIIEQADKALYVSKSEGRNRVTFNRPGLLFKVTHTYFGTTPAPKIKPQQAEDYIDL